MATPEMAVYCFEVILASLQGRPALPCPSSIPNANSPIFVTLKTLPRKDLRGCIGSFNPQPLHEQLKQYSMAAAFQDGRFAPVTIDELPQLTCTVSLLHSFEKCRTWDDWVVGTHGICINYKHYGATYLPSVAEEQGWDHSETLRSLLAKAGYRSSVDAAVLKEVQVSRYQVSCATVSYSETALSVPS